MLQNIDPSWWPEYHDIVQCGRESIQQAYFDTIPPQELAHYKNPTWMKHSGCRSVGHSGTVYMKHSPLSLQIPPKTHYCARTCPTLLFPPTRNHYTNYKFHYKS